MGMAGCACARRRRTVCSRRLHCRRHSRREPAESREPPPQPCEDVSISVLCSCFQLLCSNTCLSSIAFKCCKSLTCINTWHADLAQSMLSLPVQMSVRCIRSASYSRMLSHQKRVYTNIRKQLWKALRTRFMDFRPRALSANTRSVRE